MPRFDSYILKSVEASVFRAYDIRGIVNTQLDENAFYTIGRAISIRLKALQRKAVFLARDARLSSERLSRALAKGLLDHGINVIDLGIEPTPLMYYAAHTDEQVDSGVMVTGSHNPSDYNGIKLVLAGLPLTQDDIQQLQALTTEKALLDSKETGQHAACYTERSMQAAYIQRILKDVSIKRSLRVVVDAGNGMASLIAPALFKTMRCEVIPLYCELDGRFPNHHPDPTVESNIMDLKALVLEKKADIGLAFDGDADRLGVITNRGEIIWPDRLMMLYARDVLSRHPEGTIVYDVKCSSHLAEVIRDAGGVAKMCPTGHSIVKRVMKEERAVLAGEMSGHLFFNDCWYGFDDALYSAARLLDILSRSEQTVGEQFDAIPNSVNTPEIKIPIPDDEKFEFMQQLRNQAQFPGGIMNTIDGLRVEFPIGWGLIRASNTTPCLVARFEAQDAGSLAEVQALFKAQIQEVSADLEVPF